MIKKCLKYIAIFLLLVCVFCIYIILQEDNNNIIHNLFSTFQREDETYSTNGVVKYTIFDYQDPNNIYILVKFNYHKGLEYIKDKTSRRCDIL